MINQDSDAYIKSWDEFVFLPGSLEALNLLTRNGFQLIVITNQSIINRGMVPADVLADTHRRLQQAVRRTGGEIKDIFFCPHRPDERCDCRKPKPGLIRKACRQYSINASATIMIGDSAKDIEAGRSAGCGGTILVKTGNGSAALAELSTKKMAPDAVADDLLHAAQLILSGRLAPGA